MEKGGQVIKSGGWTIGKTTRLLHANIKIRNTQLTHSKLKSFWKALSSVSKYHPTIGYNIEEIEAHINNVSQIS